MMALKFTTKKAAKEALASAGTLGPEHVIETSFFGPEFKDGKDIGVVVSTAPDRIRNAFASIDIVGGRIVKVR